MKKKRVKRAIKVFTFAHTALCFPAGFKGKKIEKAKKYLDIFGFPKYK